MPARPLRTRSTIEGGDAGRSFRWTPRLNDPRPAQELSPDTATGTSRVTIFFFSFFLPFFLSFI